MNAVTRHMLAGAATLVMALRPVPAVAIEGAATEPVQAILERFTHDYARDPLLIEGVFGIRVGNESWSVSAAPSREGRPPRVVLAAGPPREPTFVFTLDRETLEKIDRGEWTAGTAMGKARASDPAPMDLDIMPGFEPEAEFKAALFSVVFHFWNRGEPEVTRFGEGHARLLHGGEVTVLHCQPGFRSAWFRLTQGQRANADPRDQVHDFPSVVVVTRGRGRARVGGREVELGEGQSMMIPAGVDHEFWNEGPQPMEGVLMMFGAGA